MTDRIAHGRTADGGEIVRYDRAGKWYVEYDSRIANKPRRAVGVREAATLATAPGGEATDGQYGGARFSSLVRQLRAQGTVPQGRTPTQ